MDEHSASHRRAALERRAHESARRVGSTAPRRVPVFVASALAAALVACRREAPTIVEAPDGPNPASPPAANDVAPVAPPADAEPPIARVVDTQDGCPDAPETINGYRDSDGCPDDVPPELAAFTGVLDGVRFAIDKDQLTPDSFPALDRIAAALQQHPDVQIEIQGHSDARSEVDQYSRCLTCRRADAIERYLIHRGIEAPRLRSVGYGESRPIDSNKTEAGRRRNRRVEIYLLGPDGAPAPAAPRPGEVVCLDRRTLRRAGGELQNCYPYACRAGRCLERCAAMTDCAGAHHPGELRTEGWPLECMPSGQCTPMPPEKVP